MYVLDVCEIDLLLGSALSSLGRGGRWGLLSIARTRDLIQAQCLTAIEQPVSDSAGALPSAISAPFITPKTRRTAVQL